MLGKLIEQVKCLLSNTVDIWEKLELVDNMEKLGLAYLFEHEIEKVLDTLVSNASMNLKGENNLYNTALLFKLLREHGHHVSEGTDHMPFPQFIYITFLKVQSIHDSQCIQRRYVCGLGRYQHTFGCETDAQAFRSISSCLRR